MGEGRAKNGKIAVVLLSGGLDSAVALAAARADGFVAHALTIDYQQRHRAELAAAARVAGQVGAAGRVTMPLNLRVFGGSALTSEIGVPKTGDGHEIGGAEIPVTYVPARNMVFLSLAAAYAETLGSTDVFIGVNAVDYSGYPDCRPAFIEAMARTIGLATKIGVEGGAWRIHTPLIDLTKAEIITLGARLGVDLGLTHSCYDPVEPADRRGDWLACGACDSCVLRARGFVEAGVTDPTRYAANRRA